MDFPGFGSGFGNFGNNANDLFASFFGSNTQQRSAGNGNSNNRDLFANFFDEQTQRQFEQMESRTFTASDSFFSPGAQAFFNRTAHHITPQQHHVSPAHSATPPPNRIHHTPIAAVPPAAKADSPHVARVRAWINREIHDLSLRSNLLNSLDRVVTYAQEQAQACKEGKMSKSEAVKALDWQVSITLLSPIPGRYKQASMEVDNMLTDLVKELSQLFGEDPAPPSTPPSPPSTGPAAPAPVPALQPKIDHVSKTDPTTTVRELELTQIRLKQQRAADQAVQAEKKRKAEQEAEQAAKRKKAQEEELAAKKKKAEEAEDLARKKKSAEPIDELQALLDRFKQRCQKDEMHLNAQKAFDQTAEVVRLVKQPNSPYFYTGLEDNIQTNLQMLKSEAGFTDLEIEQARAIFDKVLNDLKEWVENHPRLPASIMAAGLNVYPAMNRTSAQNAAHTPQYHTVHYAQQNSQPRFNYA